MKVILALGMTQCTKCYAPLQNTLGIDTENYLNNVIIFKHPHSESCIDSEKESAPVLASEFFIVVDKTEEPSDKTDQKILNFPTKNEVSGDVAP